MSKKEDVGKTASTRGTKRAAGRAMLSEHPMDLGREDGTGLVSQSASSQSSHAVTLKPSAAAHGRVTRRESCVLLTDCSVTSSQNTAQANAVPVYFQTTASKVAVRASREIRPPVLL